MAKKIQAEAERTTLNTALRDGLRARGVSIEAAATQVGVPASSLRSWLHVNKYPSDVLDRLMTLAGVESPPSPEFDFQTTRPKASRSERVRKNDLLRIKGIWDERGAKLQSILPDLYTDVREIFSALDQEDAVVIGSSTELPLEWDDVEFRQVQHEFFGALTRKATFIYLYPSKQHLGLLQAVINHPLRNYEQCFAAFKSRVKERLGTEAARADQIHYVTSESSWFFTPGFKFALLCPRETTTPMTSFIVAPISDYGQLHALMGREWTKYLFRDVSEAIAKSQVPQTVKNRFD